jgi:hypothetical protein
VSLVGVRRWVRCDRGVPAPEELSRDELIALVGTQAQRIAAQDGQITRMAGELAALTEANEALAGKLARLEHLLPRNSENSSSPPSKDDQPGRKPLAGKDRRGGGPKRELVKSAV